MATPVAREAGEARVCDHPDCPWATEDSSLGLATLVPRKHQGLLEEQATDGVSV